MKPGDELARFDVREGVTLYRGDCYRVLPTVGRVDAVVTDPPFGLGNTVARSRPTKWQRKHGDNAREWDKVPARVAPLLSVADSLAIWGGNYYPLPPSRGWLVWYNPDALPSMSSAELAWTNRDACLRLLPCSIGETNRERVGHPTQKPIAVMRWTIEYLNLPSGSVILDPFMGSGTTGVAAVELGYRFIGIEIDPGFFSIALDRISKAGIRPHAPVIRRKGGEESLPLFGPEA